MNDLPDVRLIAYQNGCDRKDGIHINKNSFKMFGWEYPIREKKINIELEFENVQYAADIASFYFDKIDSDEAKEFLVNSKHGSHFPSYRFMVSTFIEDSTKKLRFFKDDPVLEKYRKEDKINLQLQITFKEIGISLIGEYNKKRIEIMYIYLFNPEFAIFESQISRSTQLRVKYINIDNASSENTIFPVAFTPTKLEDILRKENKFHLDMCLDQNIMANNVMI